MDISELQATTKNPPSADDFETIRESAEDCLEFGTVQDKMDYADYISGILSQDAAGLSKSNPEIFDKFEDIWALLAFGAFIVYPSADQDNLLRTRLLFAVQSGFNPDDLIRQYYYFFNSDDFITYNLKLFVKSIEQNSESLGDFPIVIEGKKMLPQIKYWALDYSKYPSLVAKRGSVERLNYANRSQNVAQLTQIQRQNLLKILKFYDDLQNPERPLANSKPARTPQPAAAVRQKPPVQPEAARVAVSAAVPPGTLPDLKINIEDKLDDLRKRMQE